MENGLLSFFCVRQIVHYEKKDRRNRKTEEIGKKKEIRGKHDRKKENGGVEKDFLAMGNGSGI